MDKHAVSAPFTILAAAFLAGIVIGTLSGTLSSGTGVPLSVPTFSEKLFSIALFPALAVLLGTSLVGIAAIPIVTALKGFTLAFSLTVAMTAADPVGKFELLKLKGPSTLIMVPILLILSTQALIASLKLIKLAGRVSVQGQIYGSRYWLKVIVCSVILILTAMFL